MGAPTEALSSLPEEFGNLEWRLNNLYRIRTKDDEVVQFRPNWAQQELLDNLWTRNLILKARQLGFTTFIQILALDGALWQQQFRAGIIAHTLPVAHDIFADIIQFAYDDLLERWPELRPIFKGGQRKSSTRELRWAWGSSIRVGTSFRGGTPSLLHVSEFGKICAKFPDRAREIVSGALEAVALNSMVFIESTAEGNEGYFYNYATEAKALQDANKRLTPLDFRLHFFPWWREKGYALSDADTAEVVLTQQDRRYFDRIEIETGQTFTPNQKAWYVKKRDQMRLVTGMDGMEDKSDIRREHPSTFEEAFEAAVEGAYFTDALSKCRQRENIGRFPHDPRVPVHTFWDLGIGQDDYVAIWFFQQINTSKRMIFYLEDFDEGADFYAQRLQELQNERKWVFGKHFLPHDGRKRVFASTGGISQGEFLEQLGVKPVVYIEAPPGSVARMIAAARSVIPSTEFDEEGCALGLKRLSNFRKEYDEKLQVFRDKYRHDINSHGATAFLKYAAAWHPRYNSTSPNNPAGGRRRRKPRSFTAA